jgi:hypothetical protein
MAGSGPFRCPRSSVGGGLGTLLGRDTVSGEWTDTAVGLDDSHTNIARLQTPTVASSSSSTSTPTRSRRSPPGPTRSACTAWPSRSTTSTGPSRWPRGGWHPLRAVGTYGTCTSSRCPRPQRHHRHACRGAEELTPGRSHRAQGRARRGFGWCGKGVSLRREVAAWSPFVHRRGRVVTGTSRCGSRSDRTQVVPEHDHRRHVG